MGVDTKPGGWACALGKKKHSKATKKEGPSKPLLQAWTIGLGRAGGGTLIRVSCGLGSSSLLDATAFKITGSIEKASDSNQSLIMTLII